MAAPIFANGELKFVLFSAQVPFLDTARRCGFDRNANWFQNQSPFCTSHHHYPIRSTHARFDRHIRKRQQTIKEEIARKRLPLSFLCCCRVIQARLLRQNPCIRCGQRENKAQREAAFPVRSFFLPHPPKQSVRTKICMRRCNWKKAKCKHVSIAM